jgi:hypothetical protein
MCTLAMQSALAAAPDILASAPEIHDAIVVADGSGIRCELNGTVKRAKRMRDLFTLDGLYEKRLTIAVHGQLVGHRLFVRAGVAEAAGDLKPFMDSVNITAQ